MIFTYPFPVDNRYITYALSNMKVSPVNLVFVIDLFGAERSINYLVV